MKTAFTLLSLLTLAGAAFPVAAQGVYRIVGPDGRVTFSDLPPVNPALRATPANLGAGGGAGAGPALPFELAQVANRYPVVLYTGDNCAPCLSGRNLLESRGVPYTEKTVGTAQDAEALQRLAGEASLPFLTIGGQKLRGFSVLEWSQYLDAAGYPRQSTLPPGYRRPAASPLVAVVPAGAASPTARADAPREPEIPVQPPATNPAGIRF